MYILGKTETESASQTAWFESKEDYMEALGELAVEKNKFEELKTAPVRFYADPHEGMIPNAEEVNDEETLIFNQQPLQEVEPVGGLDTVIPKNLYGYHLNKVSNVEHPVLLSFLGITVSITRFFCRFRKSFWKPCQSS